MDGQTCCIRFELSSSPQDQIYIQPLYYLAENFRQSIVLDDIDKIDADLEIDGKSNINLQMEEVTTTKDKTNFCYILDKISGEINFIYKKVSFSLKVLKYNNEMPIVIKNNFTRLSYYEISFLKKEFDMFEHFIETTTLYYVKFFHEGVNDKKEINLFVNQDGGHYFDFIDSRKKRSLDTIYLPHADKKAIIDDLTTFLLPSTMERYAKLGINYKRIYLFEGVPGAGKTSFIFALASHFDYDVATISFGPKFTDTDMIHILRNINSSHKSGKRNKFLILEDMDCIFKERKSNDEARNMISFSGLLNVLDGIATPHNLVVFITTNFKNNLDAALIRPGRVDYIMSFGYVIKEQVIDIFVRYMNLVENDLAVKFYNAMKDLKINVTFSLVQQYLLKYIDNPITAIDNIDEMKFIYYNTVDDKSVGLYS